MSKNYKLFPKVCKCCNKEFEAPYVYKYCPECTFIGDNGRPGHYSYIISKDCKCCGTTFSYKIKREKKVESVRLYCDNCKNLKNRASTVCICETCKKEFKPVRKTARFCSYTCSGKWIQTTGQGQQRTFTEKEIKDKVSELCLKFNRQFTLDELQEHTGISEIMLRKYSLHLPELLQENDIKISRTGFYKDSIYFASNFEYHVYESLKSLFSENQIIMQKSFKACIGSGGQVCRFDFYIPEKNILIEANGNQHYSFDSSKPFFGSTIKNDAIKKQYCKQNNIKLIEIKYFRRVKFEDFKKRIRKIILDSLGLG